VSAVDVIVKYWHTFDRVFGTRDPYQLAALTGAPFTMPPGGDGVSPVSITVADLTELAAVPTVPTAGGVPNGTIAFVRDYDDLYLLNTANVNVPDALEVIAAEGGVGNWVATTQGRWDDIQGSVAVGNAASALTNEVYRDTPWRGLFFRHDQNDALHFVYQFPHKWRTTTSVHPHIHIIPMADPAAAQNIYFIGQYAWSTAGAGQAVPANAGWTPFNATQAVQPGDVYEELVVGFAVIPPPAWAAASANLLVYLQRNGTNPFDTYTTNKDHGTGAANVLALFSDVHYRASRFGTVTEYA